MTLSEGIKRGLMYSRAGCRLPLRQGLNLPAAPGGKLNEAAQRSHSGAESWSRDVTPGRWASGPSVPTLLYFAEESMGGSPPEARAGRAFQRPGPAGQRKGSQRVWKRCVLAACERGTELEAGHG